MVRIRGLYRNRLLSEVPIENIVEGGYIMQHVIGEEITIEHLDVEVLN